jgi:hypothetical protein
VVGEDVDLSQRAFMLVVLEQTAAGSVRVEAALVLRQSRSQHSNAMFVVFHDRLVRLLLIKRESLKSTP